MRVKPKVNVRIYDDTAGKDVLFAPDDAAAERTLDGLREQSSGKVVLTQANVPFTLPKGSITAVKGAFVRCDTDFTLAVNGGAALSIEKPLKASGVDDTYAVACLDVAANTIVVGLDGAVVEATLIFALWGDEVA